jgi:type II secretion system protein C
MELLQSITNSRIWNRHGQTIAWSVTAACLLIAVASVGWDIYQQRQLKATNYAPQTLPPISRNQTETYRVSTIVRANLFGDATPAPVIVQARPTTLDLELQGVLWATDNNIARAIITSGKRNAELYSVGEAIKGTGASIKEIRDGEVLLDRNGALESLLLSKKFKSDNSLISYASTSPANEVFEASMVQSADAATSQPTTINRTSPKPISPNGQPRKIKKPNFSGLDKALKKMGEI